jgi:hypothetical protein
MVGKINIRVEGLREIEAAMKELGAQAANRIARSAPNSSAPFTVAARSFYASSAWTRR